MATLHQAKFMGLSTIVNTKSARPKGWSPKRKKKKGHLLIRSGFGVDHRPKNAKISAITQVLTFFFFWRPPLWVCRIFDQKVGTSPEKAGRMVTLSIGGISI